MRNHPLEVWLRHQAKKGRPVRKFALARDVGCSPGRITQLLKGEAPSLALAVRLSKRTQIPAEDFFIEKCEKREAAE